MIPRTKYPIFQTQEPTHSKGNFPSTRRDLSSASKVIADSAAEIVSFLISRFFGGAMFNLNPGIFRSETSETHLDGEQLLVFIAIILKLQ
jgi:hypothetical protein